MEFHMCIFRVIYKCFLESILNTKENISKYENHAYGTLQHYSLFLSLFIVDLTIFHILPLVTFGINKRQAIKASDNNHVGHIFEKHQLFLFFVLRERHCF